MTGIIFPKRKLFLLNEKIMLLAFLGLCFGAADALALTPVFKPEHKSENVETLTQMVTDNFDIQSAVNFCGTTWRPFGMAELNKNRLGKDGIDSFLVLHSMRGVLAPFGRMGGCLHFNFLYANAELAERLVADIVLVERYWQENNIIGRTKLSFPAWMIQPHLEQLKELYGWEVTGGGKDGTTTTWLNPENRPELIKNGWYGPHNSSIENIRQFIRNAYVEGRVQYDIDERIYLEKDIVHQETKAHE